MNAENGPLVVVPKSHQLPPLDLERLRREKLQGKVISSISDEAWNAYQSSVEEQAFSAGLMPKEVFVSAGDIIIWHPEMLHGGAPHRVPSRSRKSIVMHVTPRDTPVFHIDAFFGVRQAAPTVHKWKYGEIGDRLFVDHDLVDFGHEFTVKPSSLLLEGRRRWPSFRKGLSA